MKYFIFLFLVLISANLFAQKSLDTKISIIVNDSVGLYEKVRIAMVNHDLIVKDNGRKDTVSTYMKELNKSACILIKAAIKGDKVSIWGFHGYRNTNLLGITEVPNNFEKIFYYKKDRYWQILAAIAAELHGTLSYE